MPILSNLCFLFWILITSGVFCYNVDTEFPILYQNGRSEDYFGFSVGLIRNSHGFRALITAPRANSNSSRILRRLHRPGALFSCEISPSKDVQGCDEIEVDPEGNVNHENMRYPDLSYFNKRDDMWLGVSLDTQHVSKDNNVVVCGHLWKNEYESMDYYVSGACYVLNSDLNTNTVDKIIPFVDTGKNIGTRALYYQSAQAGASAAFSEDGLSLLLGSPGFQSWKGTFVSYQLNIGMETQNLNDPMIPVIGNLQRSSAAYIGYSITSGRFFDDRITYTAVGAPRDNDYIGRVFIFLPLNRHRLTINNPFLTIEGRQIGEYFGASVNGIDLNGDDLTDLLVGAPFYSEESGGDEGKVYVYIGTTQKTFLPNFHLNGQNVPNARFGTCIGNTGDLNQDGFNDVAIGAPYEDENGVVYIYHGRTNGIHRTYAQRISGKDIRSSIAGFGISISRGLDIDNNTYPDILIESYASSSAVLLRTRPVIRLKARIYFDVPKIDMSRTECDSHGLGGKFPCVNVTYCLSYSGTNVSPSLQFQIVLRTDTDRRMSTENVRGFFLSGGQLEPQTSMSQNVLIRKQQSRSCFQETAYIYKNISDEITPLQFLLQYDLDRNATVSCQSTGFLKHCPVIDPVSPPIVTQSINFKIDCKNICQANLSVEAYVVGNPKKRALIVGQNSSLTLEATVRNSGEPAYLTELSITLPPETPLLKHDQCEKARNKEEFINTTLKCRFRNPLKNGEAVNIQIVIDATAIPAGTSSLMVYFVASTISEDIDKIHNERMLTIYFESAADVNITGNPENSEIPQTKDRGTVSITHNYYVKYYGPSPVDKIDINLYIPSIVKGGNGTATFLTLDDFVPDSGEISTKCNSSFSKMRFESYDEKKSPIQASETPEVNRSTTDSNRRVKRSPEETATGALLKGGDYTLDCESTECEVIQCEASPFRSGQKSIKFTLTVQVDLDVLSSVMGAWNSVTFITKGEISMAGVKMLSNIYRNETTVETAIVRLRPPGAKVVEKWIIFVSIGVGLLLLLIILVVLIKIGFFKRKQRDRMKSMRNQAHAKEMQEMPPVDEKEVADDKDLCPNDRS